MSIEGNDWSVPVDKVDYGTQLICDAGFNCLAEGSVVTVMDDIWGLHVMCSGDGGKHYLDGQLDDEGGHYVGFRLSARLSQEGE